MATIWKSDEIQLRDGVSLDVALNADDSVTLGVTAGRPLAEDLTFINDAKVQALIDALQSALDRKHARSQQ